jgi:hypothetical protein
MRAQKMGLDYTSVNNQDIENFQRIRERVLRMVRHYINVQ